MVVEKHGRQAEAPVELLAEPAEEWQVGQWVERFCNRAVLESLVQKQSL